MRSQFLLSALSIATAGTILVTLPAQPAGARNLIRGKISMVVQQANTLFMERKYEEAASLYRTALKRNPKDVESRAGLGMALAMQFKLDAADQEFDKALELDGANALAQSGKALVTLNRLQSSDKTIIDNRSNLLASAEDHALKAIDADPSSEQGHYALGRVLVEEGKDADAYSSFQKALELNPQSWAALTSLGQLDLKEGKVEQAIDELQKAVSLNSGNSTAHFALGEALVKTGKLSEGIKELNTSLYQHPNSAPVHMALGNAYEEQKNYDAALKEYEKAALIKPEYKAAYAKMADLHIKLGNEASASGNTVTALKEFKQSVLVDPMNPKPYLAMAQLREQRGDLELAISELNSGLELLPEDASLKKRIGHNYLKMGRVDDAITQFESVLKAKSDPEVVHELTQALYLKSRSESQDAFVASSDYETAEATLTRAIKLQPNDLKLRLALAKLHSIAGKPANLAHVGTPRTVPEKISYAEALLAQNQFDKSFEQMQDVIKNTKSASDAVALAEIAMLNMDHESAALAFAKAAELGDSQRAQFGIAAINRLRQSANERLHLADDLAKRNQLVSAADGYRDAIAANPRLAEAHLGLAKVEEKLSPKSATSLDNAVKELQAFIDLRKSIPEAEKARTLKHIQALQTKAAKLRLKETVAER